MRPAPPRAPAGVGAQVEQDLVDLRGVGQDVGASSSMEITSFDVRRIVHRSRLVTSWMNLGSETARLMVSRRRLKAGSA